jgi:hypothetical protein
MTERDPLDRLSQVANQPERPAPEFRDQLLGELLSELTADQPLEAVRSVESNKNQPNTNEPTKEFIMLSPESNQLSKRPRTGLLVAASVAAVALIGGLVVVANRDDPAPPADLPEPTVPSTEPLPERDPARTGDEVPNAPVGLVGDQIAPVPAGEIADIGEGYRLQVLSVTEDATEEVLARSESTDQPPEGSRYTLVSVAAGYYGSADPQEGFLAFIRPFGVDGEELDRDCGQFSELGDGAPVNLFAGAVVRGDLCFVTTPADTEVLVIQAFGESGSDNSFLDATTTPSDVPEMPTLSGIQPGTTSEEARQNPTAIGAPADVEDTGWSVTVTGPAVDITDIVLAEDPGNAAPPDGFRFIGVPMSMEHGGTTDEAPFVVNARAVGDSNVQYENECGAVPGALDAFTPVPAGTSVEGQLCFVVSADEVDSMTVYTGRTLADVFFATQPAE